MTLIAAVANGSTVTVVADTKVTYEHDAIQTAKVFDFALPKIVLLRDDLAVAISGDWPDEIIRCLMPLRRDPLSDIVDHLRGVPDAGFIVASANGSLLLTVGDGELTKVPDGQVALEGDPSSFADFTRLYDSSRAICGESASLAMAMDSLAGPLGRHASVGGFCMVATSASGAFRFVGRPTTIAPRVETPVTMTSRDDEFSVGINFPAGNSSWFQSVVLAGMGATPGASGIFIRQAHVGRLYTHDRPFQAEILHAVDVATFAAESLKLGQELAVVSDGLLIM